MITKTSITNLIHQKIEGTSLFLVDLTIKPGNKIAVELDADGGITIEQCVEVSRWIEHNLDRDTEDFELTVSSPGISKPLRHQRQYPKNIGRTLSITTIEDQSIEGKLIEFIDNTITLEVKGVKKKDPSAQVKFNLNQIKQAKVVVSFN